MKNHHEGQGGGKQRKNAFVGVSTKISAKLFGNLKKTEDFIRAAIFQPQKIENLIIVKPTEGLAPHESARVEKKLAEFSKHVKEAEELDAEIVKLQQASRTSFKAFRKLHAYLCVRSKLYNNLHSLTYSNQINIGALVIFVVSLSIGIGTFYTPALKVADKPVFVQYIKASSENDSTVLTGKNAALAVGFSEKSAKLAGVTVDSASGDTSTKPPLGLYLLADGLAIPSTKQLGQDGATGYQPNTKQKLSFVNVLKRLQNFAKKPVDTAQAQSVNTGVLPASTVAHIDVEAPNPEMVVYNVTDDIKVRYSMSESKVKETITIRNRAAITGNSISFALQSDGLVFKKAEDGSWQAYASDDKDHLDTATALYRLHRPTIEDKDKHSGQISMTIVDDRAIYTVDQAFLDSASYPIVIDPTISQSGRTCNWNNGAGTGVWATANNWTCTSGNGPPAAGDAVVFNTTSTANANAAAGTVADDIYSLTLASGYTGTVSLAAAPINSNDVTPNNYKWDMETLTVTQGNLVLTGDTAVNPTSIPSGCSSSVKCGRGIEINANSITVGSSGTINADGKGFGTQAGPGRSSGNGRGGSHAGQAGFFQGGPVTDTYGTLVSPTELGSGGDSTAGGGAVILTVSGTLSNSGRISANGAADTPACTTFTGAGGSVNVTAGTISGNGSFQTNGGATGSNGSCGAEMSGGGGRIALSMTTDSYSGSLQAFAGDTHYDNNCGGNGTIYKKISSQTYGDLIIDAGYSTIACNSPLKLGAYLSFDSYAFDNIVLKNHGVVKFASGSTLNLQPTTFSSADGTGTLAIVTGATITTNSSLTVSNWILALDNTSTSTAMVLGSVTSLTIASGGILTHSPNTATPTNLLNFSVSDLTVQSGGYIDVNGKGYQSGTGTGTSTLSSGASYGGLGGLGSNGSRGPTYGSSTNPTDFGSGGFDIADYADTGRGGGLIILGVSGTLSDNGTIQANGQINDGCSCGPGSGGSIKIVAGTLSGNGNIFAKGGAGSGGAGGGGGGRIALYVGTDSGFSGTKSAAGGTGTAAGAAGTNVSQHYPVVTVNSPSPGATGQSQHASISFTGTDSESDYWFAQLEISTDSFNTSCVFTMTATVSSFNAGTCSGGYSTLAGTFSGMNYDSNSNSSNDAYTAGTTGTFTFSSDLTQAQSYQIRVKGADPAGAAGTLAGGGSLFSTVISYGSTNFTVSPITKLIYSTSGSDTSCTDTSSAQTIVVTQPSSVYNVQVCNNIDEAVKMTSDQVVALSRTGSSTGVFSTTSNGTYTTTLNITISSGSSSASFYFKDSATGTPTLVASATGQSWSNATQAQTIKSDTPSRLGISLAGNPSTIRAGASTSATISAYDQYGNIATDFTGSKTLVLGGASNSSSAPNGQSISPTFTNSSGTAIDFGSNTVVTFTNGVSQARTLVVKLPEAVVLTVQDMTSGAGISNAGYTTSFRTIPGAINRFTLSDYPQASTGQFASAGFPWNTTGSLAAGNQAPYDPVATAYDAYGNIKYDYEGVATFSMDNDKVYSFPTTYTFTWNQSHTSAPIRTSTSDTYDNGRHIFNSSEFTSTSSGSSLNLYLTGDSAVQNTFVMKIKPAAIGRIGIVFSPTLTSDVVDTTLNSDVVVTAYDILGNVKTDYAGSIYFKSTDTLATLPYTQGSQYTFLDTDTGSKTFDKATFKFGTGGNHTISALDITTNSECNPDPTSPNYANCYVDTTNQVVVPVHPVSNFSATAGHQSVTLSWKNPVDPAVSKVSIYQSSSSGVLGSKLSAQPAVSAGAVSQYTVGGLTNGNTYYFTLKEVHLDPNGADVESTASTQLSAIPADIAPRDVTASQGSDGRIAITYGLRFDATVSISYYNPTSNSYIAASSGAMSGDVGAGISGSNSIDAHTAYLTLAIDFPNQYFTVSQGFKVRIDVISQGSSAQGVSNNLLLDTTPPHVNSGESLLLVDATGTTSAKLTLLAREDGAVEQAIQYRMSNNADMSGATSYTTLATKPTVVSGWDLGTNGTVYVQFKDPYNNVTSTSSAVLTTPIDFALKDGSSPDANQYRLLLVWTDPAISNFSKFLVDRSEDGTHFTEIDTTTKNGYINVGLQQAKRYSYRVKTEDTAGNVSRPTEVLTSQPGAAPDITAKPDIQVQNWKQEFGVRATVTWKTDQISDSFVVYSKKPLAAGASTLTTDGTAAQVVGQFDKTLAHSVLVQQLDPSTKYYFKTLSQNEIKITGASSVVELTTPARIPLTLSGLKFTDTKPKSTQVTWETNKLSTTVLEYGSDTNYGKQLVDSNLNTDHTSLIDGLADGSTYHVRVKATDADENVTTSDDYVFSTPATPTISNARVDSITSISAVISWNTNVNTDSNVEFGTSTAYGSQQGKSDTTTIHSVTIIGLTPATSYNYRVRSADAFGNIVVTGNASFTTPKDTTPPVISNVKSEITTSGEGESLKIQSIISWDTDEASTSQVEYGVGLSGEYPNKTTESASFNQSHTVILSDLKANASYQYRIVSKDAAGNIAKGDDLTLVTPSKNKSLLQLVLKSLEDTFSWTRRLKDAPLIKRLRGN